MIRGLRASYRSARAIAGVFVFASWLGGCALIVPQTEELRGAWPAGLPERTELTEVPFFPQQEYQCGPAALATVLANLKLKVVPEDLVKEVYLPARQGSLQVEMLAAPRRHGLVSYQLAPRFENLLREVAAGTPVIVLQDYGVWPFTLWHYAVVVGYDQETSEVFLRSGEKQRLRMPFAVLEYTWRDNGYWAMVVVPPDRVPVTAAEEDYLAAVLALERVGDPGAARSGYAALLGRWPENLGASIGLANSYYKLGDLRQAEAVLRRAAERHPDSTVVLNNLAQTLSDLGRDDEALRLIDRAIALGGPFADAARQTREAILRKQDKVN
ncbi:MAG TPA: PA2778 family cysteine peptidase [Burkholderiales bacterium]|nr:PA2778 family cysteine peptidase [Burkholderiales bacterium]